MSITDHHRWQTQNASSSARPPGTRHAPPALQKAESELSITPSHLSVLSFSLSFFFFFSIQGQLRLGAPCSATHTSCRDPQTCTLNTGNAGVSARGQTNSQTNSSAPPLAIKRPSWCRSPQSQATRYSSWL